MRFSERVVVAVVVIWRCMSRWMIVVVVVVVVAGVERGLWS